MATYAQWRRSFSKAPKVTWVCGDQSILIQEIVSVIKNNLLVSDTDIYHFYLTDDEESDTWRELNSLSLDYRSSRLTIIHNSQLIKDFSSFERVCNSKQDIGNFIFISDELDFPRHRPRPDQKLGDLKAHIKLAQSRGSIVRCSTLTENECIKWAIRLNKKVPSEILKYLTQSANYDLRLIRDVCVKLSWLEVKSISRKTIDSLLSNTSGDFVDSLIFGNKASALSAIHQLEDSEPLGCVRLLDSRLDLLHSINESLITGATQKYDFLTRKYKDIANMYDASRRSKNKKLLTVIEDSLLAGSNEAVLESLVALW